MTRNRLRNLLNFFEAWVLLHVSRIVILFFPFKRIMGFLGKPKKPILTRDTSISSLFEVRLAISRAASYSFHKSKCYDQALTAKMMLKARKISAVIYFGVAKEADSGLAAHAWVKVGSHVVVGGETAEKFTPLVWFGEA